METAPPVRQIIFAMSKIFDTKLLTFSSYEYARNICNANVIIFHIIKNINTQIVIIIDPMSMICLSPHSFIKNVTNNGNKIDKELTVTTISSMRITAAVMALNCQPPQTN